MIEALKIFDIVFVFILCVSLSCASLGILISECVCDIIDSLKKKRRKRREKIQDQDGQDTE